MTKDPISLSIDELDEESARLKAEITALQDTRRTFKAERDRKVFYRNAEEAVARVGLTGVVVIPDTAHLTAKAVNE